MTHFGKLCGCLLMLLWAVGCDSLSTGAAGGGATDGKQQIVCTTGMVTDIVRQVVGNRYEVVGLMGEGVDPHLYKPTTTDTAKLSGADIIFYSGLMLEGRMEQALESLGKQGKPVIAVTQELSQQELLTPDGFEGHPDPHVWMSVPLWMSAVETVADEMSRIDPDNAETYQANTDVYLAELKALDEYVRARIVTIPAAQRCLVTAHDAFSYFGREYELQVESVQGITTESEPGVNDIVRLVDLLVTRKIPALFVESSVNPANLRAVLEGAKQKGFVVREGGTLYSDAMGPTDTYEGTYIGMIDHNVTTMTRALGGEAPAGGLNSKLQSGG